MPRARRSCAAAVVALIALVLPETSGAFGTPVEFVSGLASPGELAVDSKGDLWFTQTVGTRQTLYVMPRGSTLVIAKYSVNGDVPQTFITDIAFDRDDVPHFVQWKATGTSVDSAVVRVDPATGAATTLAAASGTLVGFVPTAGTAIGQVEVARDGTVLFTTQSFVSVGEHVARLQALAPGAAAPTVVATFANAGRTESLGVFTVARDGTVYLQEGSDGPPALRFGIYRLAPGTSPQLLRMEVVTAPDPSQPPLPFYVGLDGKENLIVGERGFAGRIRPGCSTSSTFRLVRYTAKALRGPAPAGTVISSATYPGHLFLLVGASTYFRVSDRGDVLFGLYPGNTRCGDPPGPTVFTDLWVLGVAGDDPSGTQQLLLEDVPSPLMVIGYSFAMRRDDAFVAAARLGRITGISLKDAKKN